MIIPHDYSANGIGAHDENGEVRCVCGYPRGNHASEQHLIAPVCGTCGHEIDKDSRGWAHVACAALSEPPAPKEQQPPSFATLTNVFMRVCPQCGDKRCPLANDPQATCVNRPSDVPEQP
jgi:hypothetical protein